MNSLFASVLGRAVRCAVSKTPLLIGSSVFMLLPWVSVTAQTEAEFYADTTASHVQPCLACHKDGGVADNAGARLIIVGAGPQQDQLNYEAFESYLALSDVDSAFLLAKVSGGAGHGGGKVHAKGAAGYIAIADLAAFIRDGVASGGSNDEADFWRGLALEPRERTLRRAWLMMRGAMPLPGQMNWAKKSDANLRTVVLKAMQGKEFHQFVKDGANNRLHFNGFLNGLLFDFFTQGHYPKADIFLDLRECEFDETDCFSTLTQNNYHFIVKQMGLVQEPLELIAYVIEKNLSYKQVLTANYTVANFLMNGIYRGGTRFPPMRPDMEVTPEMVLKFDRSSDRGQPNYLDPLELTCDPQCRFLSYGRFIQRPHAGILTTPAFLSRYPTTDTNRNRARARWTFLHFLGVDIEQSAPRSTDPVALADTDNPTLKNPACVVCHERMDPVAGTFQNFDYNGIYKIEGDNSLPGTYKYPEYFGGEPGDTPYKPGDTWYRDMRPPGINGKKTFQKSATVRWLAYQIVNDPRFAKATVAFWWPAIMGSDPLEQPTEETDPNYQQQLNAYNAQQALMDELAQKFRNRGFKAKQLFADMVMSDWFRAEGFEIAEGEDRDVELATVGSGRLLTPEELDRKNFALFGARWNESNNGGRYAYTRYRPLDLFGTSYLAYGGIDSFAVTERQRELTPLMSNVPELMSMNMGCRVPLWDMNREKLPAYREQCAADGWHEDDWDKFACGFAPPEQRPKIFTWVNKQTVPNAQNKGKIENQLVKLYEYMFGIKVNRNHADVQGLYEILEIRHQEFEDNGWIDNPCWVGNETADSWFQSQHDPKGMVAAWGSVIRTMMAHYLYLHE